MNSLSIITPCFNAAGYIAGSIESIARAAERVAIPVQYVLCDGASTDDTVRIARETARSAGLNITVNSRPDTGMYDALRSGFAEVTGDFVGYLNAGDCYFPGAFDVISKVVAEVPQVRWCTGFPTILADDGVTIVTVQPPWTYRRRLIREGWYGGRLPFISQEPTFFARSLLDSVDLDRFASLKLAGDGFLWHEFARSGEDLFVIDACLAGFRLHAGQLSSQREAYFKEKNSFADRKRLTSYFVAANDLIAWKCFPQGVKRRFAPRYIGHEFRDRSSWRLSVKRSIDYG